MKESREQLKKRIICDLKEIRKRGIAWIQKEYGVGFELAKEIYYECEEDAEEYERIFFRKRYPLDFFASYLDAYCMYYHEFDLSLINVSIEALIKEINSRQEEYKLLSEHDKKYSPLPSKIRVLKIQTLMNVEGIKMSKPDIYKSDAKKIIIDRDKKIYILPLACLFGSNYLNKVVEEREKNKFSSYEDLRRRTGIPAERIEWLIDNGYIL